MVSTHSQHNNLMNNKIVWFNAIGEESSMERKELSQLLYELEQELLRLGYKYGTLLFYKRRWKALMEYAKERGETYFTEQLGIDFARECLGIPQDNIAKRLTQSQTQDLRVIRMIGDFQLHHCILRRYMKHKELLTDPGFIKIRDDFILHCARKGYAKSTISNYEHQASRFLDFMAAQKIHDAASITIDIVNAYIRTLTGFTHRTVEMMVDSLRVFLRFLYHEKILVSDLTLKMPAIKNRKQMDIPVVWAHNELKQLIEVIDRGSPIGKRDYAIILLACKMGIRCGDIKNLRFNNFHWAEKKLCFIQSKTKQPLELPLLPEVGWAVIDYLKLGRPKTDDDHIFIRHLAPFVPFVDSNRLIQRIQTYMIKAHIPMSKKKCGLHSMRHTIAGFLLEKETPLPVISDILGHVSTNSTATYLKVDMKHLAECPLEFEEIIGIE